MLKVIILSKNSKRSCAYYHQDIIRAFQRRCNCFVYGPGFPSYNKRDAIEDVVARSPFNLGNIDLIVVAPSWENEKEHTTLDYWENEGCLPSDPHPSIDLAPFDIPKIYFLNKEYKNLTSKLAYAQRNRFDLICSATKEGLLKEWSRLSGLNIMHLPFAVDLGRFRNLHLERKYGLTFTGHLHNEYTDIRYRVKELLLGKEDHRYLNIYWAEFNSSWRQRVPIFRPVPVFGGYVRLLNRSKVVLCTPSANGTVGTRFFECMATGAMILCPQGDYGRILRDGQNCVMFKPDLSDFHALLNDAVIAPYWYRNRIAEQAKEEVKAKHTYDYRIDQILRYFDYAGGEKCDS